MAGMRTIMVAVMLMSVVLIGILCVVAYTLATYALPFVLGLAAAHFAYDTGSGLIGAGLVGLVAGAASFFIRPVGAFVRYRALRDPTHNHRAGFRRARRRGRLRTCPWRHRRSRSL